MNEMLRKRMSATQQASEQQTGDAAYEQIFQMPVPQTETQFRDIPIGKLRPKSIEDLKSKDISSESASYFDFTWD